MRKSIITCDCCGKEIEENAVYSIEHYIHVSPSFNHLRGHSKIINGGAYPVSGRTERKDFCLPCYNMIFEQLFVVIKEYRNQINSTKL